MPTGNPPQLDLFPYSLIPLFPYSLIPLFPLSLIPLLISLPDHGDEQKTIGANNQMGTNECGHTNERTKSAGYLIVMVPISFFPTGELWHLERTP
jgi:hypothetical protein